MARRKKKKNLYKFILLVIFAATFGTALFYFLTQRGENLERDSLIIERNINNLLLKLAIPEKNIITWRVEKKQQGKIWIEINKEAPLGRAEWSIARSALLTENLSNKQNYTVSYAEIRGGGALKATVKNRGLVFARITFSDIKTKPLLCIVIDDCGSDKKRLTDFMELGMPLTFSILPYHRHTQLLDASLARAGFETLLHLPMEPHKPDLKSMGKGALLTDMSAAQIKSVLLYDLLQVPSVKGVNNHMGSLFTENADKMRVVLSILKSKNLFFLDSATSPRSVCLKTASEAGVPCLRNSVFLDTIDETDKIKERIREALSIARKKGYAVAIGHVTRKNTAQSLREMKDTLIQGAEVTTLENILAEYGENK